jgi:indolepyruvate ferredoxin oxidoreductase
LIAWSIKDTIKREHRKNLKAFNIGRKLALEPRALPVKPTPETWHQLVVNKARILRKTKFSGRRWAEDFEKLANTAMKLMRHLPDETKYDLALRIYDLMQYQDFHYAKKYMDLVRGVYRRDSVENKFAATGAAVLYLAKVMLIKDEPYVSYLLTRYEKKQRDLAKYAVDVANGDRIVYRHHTRPEFVIFGKRYRLNITTTDWMLNIAKHAKFVRKLKAWHPKETAFREWYIGLLDRIDLSNPTSYAQTLTVLKCPEEVSGYREIRYPKMDRAKEMVESELNNELKVEVEVNREAVSALQSV